MSRGEILVLSRNCLITDRKNIMYFYCTHMDNTALSPHEESVGLGSNYDFWRVPS